jgi:hypothetical protein
MADRFDVVAVWIEDISAVVSCMVLRSKSGLPVIMPAGSNSSLKEGVYRNAVFAGDRDVDSSARCTLPEPEIRFSRPSEAHTRDVVLHDQLVAQRRQSFLTIALAPLEIRYGNTYMIKHYSHLPRLQDRTDIRQAEYPCNAHLHNGELSRMRHF